MNMQKRTSALKHAGKGYGQGHGGNSNLPAIKEQPAPPVIQQMILAGKLEPGTRIFSLGQCTIFVSPPLDTTWGWHLSISHPKRYPTWDEIAKARYELLPKDRTYVMVLPPPSDYVNFHNFCFQVWEDGKLRS